MMDDDDDDGIIHWHCVSVAVFWNNYELEERCIKLGARFLSLCR